MNGESSCEFLEWDSQFFEQRIARVRPSRLAEGNLSQINSWCYQNQIACLYFLADSADATTHRLASENGFHLVDIRLTLDRPATLNHQSKESSGVMRTALERDIPALRAIARASHHDSRFYWDGHFPRSACDALYEVWIERSCRGWADTVLVAEDGGAPVGYLSCHLASPEAGKIGLMGVAAQAQGKGLGPDLVHAALRWFHGRGVETVSVVTQGRNVRAQRLYQRCGFLTRSVELWFHKWFVRN